MSTTSTTPIKVIKKIGATFGLVTDCGDRRPEQVYVNITDSAERPIQIDGWVGYSTDQCMNLTTRQAKDLIALLVEAVTA